MQEIREPSRVTPVMAETDVLVVGSGPGGLSAAIAAAGEGVETMLVERYGCFGGNITQAMVEPIAWYRHESTIDPARATVLGLVLCPTRELAQQVCDVLAALALPRGVRVALVVGGDPMHPQIAALQGGAQVVVGTPGRVLDLYQQRFLSFPWTEFTVLDEADKMFEIGFIEHLIKGTMITFIILRTNLGCLNATG